MDLSKVGLAAGLATGVVVTVALRFSKKWDAPILEAGRPVERIAGAERIAEHDIRERHQEVVGPRISASAQQMPPGPLQTLVAGFGAGATEAPGVTYRLEAGVDRYLRSVGLLT